MKAQILKALKEGSEQYISGEELSNRMGVSRTAIWKYIAALREEGYDIESSPRKGYRLISSPEILSAEEIQAELSTKFFGKEIIYFDTVTSTNTIAKEIAGKDCQDGTVVIADQQTGGKGRLGRNWSSPPHTGIWMSIVLRPDILPFQAPFITILAALAVARSIKQVAQIAPKIKWPNDIILNRKKVCGILTEMSAEIERINYIVVGIGINVNMDAEDFSPEIREMATSIKMVTGQAVQRKVLVRKILENFEEIYVNANNSNLKNELMDEYRKYSLTLGSRVKVVYKNQEIKGTAVEVTDEGELIIETDDGVKQKIMSGEVSVRGIYGYV
ncbi:MAG: BirA family transcriptional regulator [Clostridiales bacterium]|jgi:BirA family biotin operon repressor/biotin-[acetyl-CoA-carboxylase] ligase|nr:BirA family transcriptional regulator [Clostridiales bacterium]MDK2933629.1 BirA family transcriptional regulator [Clostridiales bacterium]